MKNEFVNIAERVKKRRKELKMSFRELSKKTQISASTLQRYESGQIKSLPVDKFALISKALDIDPIELMGLKKNPTSKEILLDLSKKYFGDANVSLLEKEETLKNLTDIFYQEKHKYKIVL